MIDQQLAEVSNLAIVVSIVLYVMALFGFSVDIARVSQRRSDERLAQKDRELAAVGSGASSMTPADTVARREAVMADRAAAQAEASGTGSDAGSSMTPRRFGFTMAAVAAGLHLAGVIMRGVATQRPPWANMYEFAMTSAAAVMVVFLIFCVKRVDLRSLGLFVLSPMLVLMLLAQTFWIVPAAELTPSLQNSHWLIIHIGVAVLATALSILGAVVVGLQLTTAQHEKALRGDVDVEPRPDHWGRIGRMLDRLPGSVKLEGLSFRIHAVGFVCWTFTLIFGAIWAREAWGRAWGWDPKEVWTFVIWVLYAAYLHARTTGGFRGVRAAPLALAGFLAVVFNYTIVNTVINGLHSYSGL